MRSRRQGYSTNEHRHLSTVKLSGRFRVRDIFFKVSIIIFRQSRVLTHLVYIISFYFILYYFYFSARITSSIKLISRLSNFLIWLPIRIQGNCNPPALAPKYVSWRSSHSFSNNKCCKCRGKYDSISTIKIIWIFRTLNRRVLYYDTHVYTDSCILKAPD